jgi:hypothetical protein
LGGIRSDWAVRVTALPLGDVPVFVGIAEKSDIDAYLEGVAYSDVTWNFGDYPIYPPLTGQTDRGLPSEQMSGWPRPRESTR